METNPEQKDPEPTPGPSSSKKKKKQKRRRRGGGTQASEPSYFQVQGPDDPMNPNDERVRRMETRMAQWLNIIAGEKPGEQEVTQAVIAARAFSNNQTFVTHLSPDKERIQSVTWTEPDEESKTG